jgi:hypothetical protein
MLKLIAKTAPLFAAIFMVAAVPESSQGIPIQLEASRIRISDVWSVAAFDYNPATGGVGPTYFNDCLYYYAPADAIHIQFVFAVADSSGNIIGEQLPVDVRFKTGHSTDERQSACRRHGYVDGFRGLRLIVFTSRVDFADGKFWKVPPAGDLSNVIREAIAGANRR